MYKTVRQAEYEFTLLNINTTYYQSRYTITIHIKLGPVAKSKAPGATYIFVSQMHCVAIFRNFMVASKTLK